MSSTRQKPEIRERTLPTGTADEHPLTSLQNYSNICFLSCCSGGCEVLSRTLVYFNRQILFIVKLPPKLLMIAQGPCEPYRIIATGNGRLLPDVVVKPATACAPCLGLSTLKFQTPIQ